MKKYVALVMAAGLLGSMPAFAQDNAGKSPVTPPAQEKTGAPARGPEHALKMFDKLDADKDGFITPEESDAAAKVRFEKLDTNKDGKISKEEFAAGHPAPRGAKGPSPRLMKRFEMLDTDKDGFLSLEELSAQAKKAQADADTDKDGKVSRAEFEAWQAKKRAEMQAMHASGKKPRAMPDAGMDPGME